MAEHKFESASDTGADGGSAVPETACGVLAGGGALSGLLAVLGASCCVLPLALVSLGVSTTVVAQLGMLVSLQPWIASVAGVLLAAGFVAAFWGGRRPSRRTLALMLAGAAFVALSFVIPFYEPELLRWLNRP